MEKVKPSLLEPVMDVEIAAPQEYSGDIMGDLNSRRGRVQGMETSGKQQVIKAQVPMAEMLNYQSTLNSITAARGSFHMQFSHYDPVPGQLAKRLWSSHALKDGSRAAKEEESRNAYKKAQKAQRIGSSCASLCFCAFVWLFFGI